MRHYLRQRYLITPAMFLGLVFFSLTAFQTDVSAERVGKFTYRGSFLDFKKPANDTIYVNDTMVAMSEKIYALTRFFTDSISDTPSIFFIIDHSTSMSWAYGDNSNDRWGNRFRVTSAFIDTIFQKFPTAEIGYAVFKAVLHFIARDSPFFTRYTTTYDTTGGYLPLYKLNQTVGTGTDRGIDVCKRFLETDTAISPNAASIQYTELRYRPSPARSEGTNINIGFEAAIDAFRSSTRPRNSQYVIFLSDGEANAPRGQENNFVAGTNVPTTFTIYFTTDNTTPQTIVNMTNNIRTLGYPKSSYWAYNNTTFDNLMSFLRDSIYTKLVTERRSDPTAITINNQTISGWQVTDSSFSHSNIFPLIGPITPFSSIFKYNIYQNQVVIKDTTDTVDFFVKIVPGTPMPASRFTLNHWDRDLSFLYNNAVITVANETMDSLELRFDFDPGSARYNYTNLHAILSNAKGPQLDSETLELTRTGAYFSGKFKRELSTSPTPLNSVLEHDSIDDTIIAVFRNTENPQLPLDTLRVPLLFNLTTNRLLQIRLFDLQNLTTPLDTIRMTTDQSMVVVVRGKWSRDTSQWVDVPGIWTIAPNPITPQFTVPLPVNAAQLWLCDPVTSGSALLTVTSADSASTTVPMIITEADPSSLRLVLLTHPDSCYAGIPIKIGAYIENRDGPVDGVWNGRSIYRDILNNQLRSPFLPWMTVNGRVTPPDSLDRIMNQQWRNGADTLFLTLYYAPLSNDSLHQIHLTLNSTLQANTIRFKLRPGPIDSIQIEDQPGNHLTQLITLTTPDGTQGLYARGFDAYGNRIEVDRAGGEELNNVLWRTDGTLHPPVPDSIGSNILYTARGVIYYENGLMHAILIVGTKVLRDAVPIEIIPPLARPIAAITRDMNGNGYIDRIELTLSKKVDLTQADTIYFQMRYPPSLDTATSNRVTSATRITKLGDSSYAIDFIERRNARFPQTGWRPELVILANTKELTAGRTVTSDGCPPVVWRVENRLNQDNDHSKDTIVVHFSEKIVGIDGAVLKLNAHPAQTFNAWIRNPDSTFTLVPDMFVNIISFLLPIANDSTVTFLMTNKKELYGIHWVNIKTEPEPSPIIKDRAVAGNVPQAVNQKVNVLVFGNNPVINIIPNPSIGTFKRIQGGVIPDSNIIDARKWVTVIDKAGTVISITNIRVPNGYTITDPKTHPKGFIKIYDAVGNTVNSVQISNWLKNTPVETGSGMTADIYWNGANSKGMMVAPGVYRVVAYIDYPSSQKDLRDKRLISKVGIFR
ncbi:MAG: hypothetical protein JXA71_09160 [Chitinispirillaceae bacterium]|nr:hypothetical protein [Chitinispirillaceae bacterium]